MCPIAAHLALKPGFCQPPVAHDGISRNVQDGRGFFHRQAAKKPQFDDAALTLVKCGQRFQRIVELDEVVGGFVGDDKRLVERHSRRVTAALLGAARAGMVDENAAHHASRNRHEVCAIVPCDSVAIDQPQIRLVDERRRLKALRRTFARQAAACDPVELFVDERNQPLEGRLVAFPPLDQEPGDFRGVVRNGLF